MTMRIAYVCADAGVPVWGRKGCSIHVQEVLRALLRCGAQVELFATRWDGEAPTDLETVVCHTLPPIAKGDLSLREQKALSANVALRDALEQHAPFDLVYERYSLWSFGAIEWARERNGPRVLEVNAPLIQEQERHRGLVHRDEAHAVAERVFGGATAIVAVSGGVADYVKRFLPAQGRVHVVHNGVDLERFRPDVPPKVPTSAYTFTIGFAGNARPWHGLPILIDAFERLYQSDSSTRLLVVGGGDLEAIEADVVTRGLQSAVHFFGAVESSEMPSWLTSMDVAVAPYPQMEEFYFSPLKVFEYMASGRAIVASEIGELPQIIQHEQNGLLCKAGSPQALCEALQRLRKNVELRRRLGETARRDAAHHSWDAVARRILEAAGVTR